MDRPAVTGSIVHYTSEAGCILPAIVVYVLDDQRVTLQVFTDGRHSSPMLTDEERSQPDEPSVVRRAGVPFDGSGQALRSWHWPPG